MTRDKIKERVYALIDEVALPSQPAIINYPIEAILDEAAEMVLRMTPTRAISELTDFSENTVTANSDGSGTISLPSGFIKLAEFKMLPWNNDCPIMIDRSDARFQLQHNKYTRGSQSRPVVVLDSGKLTYYSIKDSTKHKIDKALAVCTIAAGDDYPEELIDALAWLAASKTLIIMREEQEAAYAQKQAEDIISKL